VRTPVIVLRWSPYRNVSSRAEATRTTGRRSEEPPAAQFRVVAVVPAQGVNACTTSAFGTSSLDGASSRIAATAMRPAKLVLSLSMRQGPAYVAATSRPDSSLRRATATRLGFSGNAPTKRLITSHADGGAGRAGQRQVAGDGIRVALDRFLRHGRRCASRRGDRPRRLRRNPARDRNTDAE